MTEEPIAIIKRLENERGRALVNADWAALAALLAEDLVHIHANGQIENKAQYLESVSTKLKFIRVERVPLHIRLYGDIAIATGVLSQTVSVQGQGTVIEMQAAITQTWIRRGDRWELNTFQATRIG